MKPLLKKWLDRVEASEIERGKILQLQTCIWPRSIGYETAGRKTTLDYDELRPDRPRLSGPRRT